MAHSLTVTGNLVRPNIQSVLAERGFQNCVLLGKGSFGEVLKAECQDDGEFYAIKCLPLTGNTVSPKYIKRELELLITLELSDRNVIKYFKSWIMQDGDVQRVCIQMELCWANLETFMYENDMGGAEIIKTQGPQRLYKQIFTQILNGLVAIHSIGWVHRDIHLGNILIVNPNPQQIRHIHVKIADFGLARYIGIEFEMSTTMTVVPTLEKLSPDVGHRLFMAPELSTDTYDFKDDQRLFKLIEWLLQNDPSRRPTAAEALAYTQSRTYTESVTKRFLLKKRGDDISYRCCSNDDTLSGIQAAIEGRFGIEKDAQIIYNERTNANGNERIPVGLTTNEDVREMFSSAERHGERPIVVVSERERGNATSKHHRGMPPHPLM
ncbi:interferon-induced, double-stranded RNA-activated kinase [Paramuricea clavata]|uniref:Interferon-induced, double-stranded RNA-activated kinase n=1 Tax=Paramuricea clavata TaxID=317549 RepID=A0A6S7LR02_PARCT|nr:interferon-induced, double-stranded RNA-activated kinase [Paramuricea clavata]